MFETTVCEGVLQVKRDGTRWLSGGYDGGITEAGAAYNITVPEGWGRTDLDAYVDTRRSRAGFSTAGPALLTGVNLDHARGARDGPVVAYATAGISNPAALPADPSGDDGTGDSSATPPGTVNIILGTTRALGDGALANLITVVAEAKSATLLAEAGFPGTTTDAVVVATDPAGEPAEYTGAATEVGAAARACTRDAVQASLRSRYLDREYPESVDAAAYGVETTRRAETFVP